MGDVENIVNASGENLVEYNYNAWGEDMGTRYLYCEGIEIEFVQINPIRFRSYYYDKEWEMYYLQSRYYDPLWGRFLNADDPDYLNIDTPVGTNLFAYCCNDPVNGYDPTGNWGESVHNGYNKNKSSSNHYNYTFINRYATPYGTYYWAITCGFTKKNAKKLGEYCIELDKKYPSANYALAIAGGVKDPVALAKYQEWQDWHFNGTPKGDVKKASGDSRRKFADKKMERAVSFWKKSNVKGCKDRAKQREKALKELGYGLHAIQDIEAHGQMGRGKAIPQHVIGKKNLRKADDINYDWANKGRTRVRESSDKRRLIDTATATRLYIKDFIKGIGGKSKLK